MDTNTADRRESTSSTDDAFQPNLDIAILTFGTRGDAQPYVRIAQELLSHGHRVRLTVSPGHESWIREEHSYIETWSLGEDMGQFTRWGLQKPRKKMMSFVNGQFRELSNKQTNMLTEHWRACVDEGGTRTKTARGGERPFVADVIMASPPGMSHIHIAQRLGIPVYLTHFNPKTPTREWPHGDCQPSDKTFKPCDENRESWLTGDSKIWRYYYKRMVNKLRKRHLDLPLLGGDFWPSQFLQLNIPMTYLISQHVLPRPDDFPPNHRLAGFTFLDSPQSFKPDPKLVDFLSAAPGRVIYVDFGSNEMLDRRPLTAAIASAVKASGVRAVIRRPWYVSNSATPPKEVYVTDDLPHSWLFPRVDVVLHAAGAGITAMSLRSGIASALMPFRADQFMWSKALERLGAAPPALFMRDMTEAKLTALIKEALDGKYRVAAEKVGEAMRNEPDGAAIAVKMLHEYLSETNGYPPRCSLLPDRQAVWTVRGRPEIRLSPLAAHILDTEKAVRYEKLELLKAVDWDKHAVLKPWETPRERAGDVVRKQRMAQGQFDAKGRQNVLKSVMESWQALHGQNGTVDGTA